MIELRQNVVTELQAAISRDWLGTNGIGGYASGTVSGANTRRYHGLLVAATKPPLGRAILISKLEETAVIDGERFELSANQYPGIVHPQGFTFLKSFRLDPFPVWTFHAGGIEIEKKAFMIYGKNATVISWSIKGRETIDKQTVSLELRPLLAFRDYHHQQRDTREFHTRILITH